MSINEEEWEFVFFDSKATCLLVDKKDVGGVGPGPGPLSNTHVKHHITLARNSHTNVTWARDSHNSKVNELLLLKGAKPKLDISMGFQSKPKILKILLDGA